MKDQNWTDRFIKTRAQTLNICEPLSIEDFVVQPSAEVSPPKWHIGHTTWFFEQLILKKYLKGYENYNDDFLPIFNSYYKAAGVHWKQGERGHLSRPTVDEIFQYRAFVDQKTLELLKSDEVSSQPEFKSLFELGLQHEQQHQELLMMDIKSILASNPSYPVYLERHEPFKAEERPKNWKQFSEGLYEAGADEKKDFCFDNELPKHKHYLHSFSVSKSLVSNKDYLEFVKDGAYEKPKYWLSKAWDWLQENNVKAPLYWVKKENNWFEYSLDGFKELDLLRPVVHLSYFEADAFARWSQARLPTEFEFEAFLKTVSQDEADQSLVHPACLNTVKNNLWCWTSSAYAPYPGFKEFEGEASEYNGKFMCNQYVLRGGSVATPKGHFRDTYRNFYEPHQRWMFSGVRLAKDS